MDSSWILVAVGALFILGLLAVSFRGNSVSKAEIWGNIMMKRGLRFFSFGARALRFRAYARHFGLSPVRRYGLFAGLSPVRRYVRLGLT